MNKIFLILIMMLFITTFIYPDTWPTDISTDIHQNLPLNYEPSGIIWHPYYNSLFLVSDSGIISQMNLDGSNVKNWNMSGDLEGITITDPDSEYVYVVTEYPYNIIRFNPITEEKKIMSLTGTIPATNASNQGIEGITFVPNEDTPYANSTNNGLFYFGVQENGAIYVVDIDFTNNNANLIDSFTPTQGRGDISDLFFNTETKILYVLYDSTNKLREITTDNELIKEYDVPGTEQEGIAILPSYPNTTATIIIGEDTPTKLVKYNNFPITYPIVIPIDSDNDGVPDDNDKCPGFDDKLDLDLDAIPDGCDAIDNRDSDNDGIINQYDIWPLGLETSVPLNLPNGFESSGIIWSPYYNALFLVSDKGTISQMNIDGSNVKSWSVPGDLEGVTITDSNSKYIYVIVEYPFKLIQFDPSNGTIVNSISLTDIIPATNSSNEGIQGITFVQNGYHQYTTINNGLFYFGMQENGIVYVLDVDFTNKNANLIDSFTPVVGKKDISDLFFNTETKTLFILYDSSNLLREITLDNSLVNEYSIPNNNLDGITLLPNCPENKTTLIIAEDSGKVMNYSNYPIECKAAPIIDSDNDGIPDDNDKCPGFDDKLDLDLDAIPDGCDAIDNRDSDNDGVINQYDICSGFDDKADLDLDTIPDGCDLSDDRDQDNDGLTNAQELIYGTNPLLADTDNDGLTDYQEINTYLTNPLLADTDNGTVSDGQEIINKTNPLNANDDVPIIIDPNAIKNYTINNNATILVNYENNTSLTIDPFSGTTKISVGTNSNNDRLIVTNGKYVSVYKRNTLVAQNKINSSEHSNASMTITNMGTYDKIVVQYPFWWFTITRTLTFTNDTLK